jgi:hypothetical protein
MMARVWKKILLVQTFLSAESKTKSRGLRILIFPRNRDVLALQQKLFVKYNIHTDLHGNEAASLRNEGDCTACAKLN